MNFIFIYENFYTLYSLKTFFNRKEVIGLNPVQM